MNAGDSTVRRHRDELTVDLGTRPLLVEELASRRGEVGTILRSGRTDRVAVGEGDVGEAIAERALGDVIPDAVVVEAELDQQRDARQVIT